MIGSPRRVGVSGMGHREKVQPISYLAPRTELSAAGNIPGVKETQRNQGYILKMLLIRSLTGLWNCAGFVSHCFPRVQPLELNRASSK